MELREAFATIGWALAANRVGRVEVVLIHQLFACLVRSGLIIEGVKSVDGKTIQREGKEVNGNGQFSLGLGSERHLRPLRCLFVARHMLFEHH